jgi:hypothetical protein
METLASFVIVPAFAILCLASIFGLAQFLSPERIRRIRRVRRGLWPLKLSLWHTTIAVAVAAFVILAFQNGYEIGLALTLISLFILAWFVRVWCSEFVFLMGLRDDDLPGRHDKLVWAFLLFAFAPIAVWLFRSYRVAHWPEPELVPETQAQLHPESQGTTTTQPA